MHASGRATDGRIEAIVTRGSKTRPYELRLRARRQTDHKPARNNASAMKI
jgi:hypothetical protein